MGREAVIVVFPKLDNFSQVTVTLPASDMEAGRLVMGASERPRFIIACSCYSGTNTAGSMMGLYVIPSQAGTLSSGLEFDLSLGGQDAIKVLQGTLPMNNSTSLGTAQCFVPSVDTRAGGTWLLLPPYSLLVMAPDTADLNGTIVVSVSSADMC